MSYCPKDYYFYKAKSENYAARSVFKLREIHERFKIFKPGYSVLDLGAAPGSWSQYASQQVQSSGHVLSIDLQPLSISMPNMTCIQEDLHNIDFLKLKQTIPLPFQLVLSDMAPRTTGIRITDQARSLELCQLALMIAQQHLSYQGHFVCKMFHNNDLKPFKQELATLFEKVELLRPQSTRKASQEIFLIALKYKKPSL